jgi:hypothetical protein
LIPKKGYLDRKAGILLVGSYILFVFLTFK